jgi:hypothetical protein
MPTDTNRTHHSQENEFHTFCLDWRFRMLSALHDYADSITLVDAPQLLPSLQEHYGDHIRSLLSELQQSALRIATLISEQPIPPTNDNGVSLTLLFEDIRNPMSSFSILDQIVGSVRPAPAGEASGVQAPVQRLVARGHDLNHLLEELYSLHKRFTDSA